MLIFAYSLDARLCVPQNMTSFSSKTAFLQSSFIVINILCKTEILDM